MTGNGEGYGVQIRTSDGRTILSWSVSWAGLNNRLVLVPEARFGMVVLANGGQDLNRTTQAALQMFLPFPPAEATDPAAPVPVNGPDASRYAGTYVNEWVVKLTVKDGQLFIRDESPAPFNGGLTGAQEVPVLKRRDGTFSVGPSGNRFALIPGQKGEIEFLHIGGRALKKM